MTGTWRPVMPTPTDELGPPLPGDQVVVRPAGRALAVDRGTVVDRQAFVATVRSAHDRRLRTWPLVRYVVSPA